MKILGIETSSVFCSVAYGNEKGISGFLEENRPRAHARILPDLVKKLFTKTGINMKDLDALAVSHGPGSFTGLRIGLSFAKGLAFSRGLPIIPVPTMYSLVHGFDGELEDNICVLIHSHGNVLFRQEFQRDHLTIASSDPEVITAEEIRIQPHQTVLHWNCGSFLDNIPAYEVQPSARWIVDLAQKHYSAWKVEKPFSLVPDYISPFVTGGKQ